MVQQVLPFNTSVQATVGADGTATVSIGPTAYNQVWRITQISCRASSNVAEPQFSYYLGPASDVNFVNGSYSGSRDSDTGILINLPGGLSLTGKWTGADVGATVTMGVLGEKVIG
jgi:hypothetical protein